MINGGNGTAFANPQQQSISVLYLYKSAAYFHNCIFAQNLWPAIAVKNPGYVDDNVDLIIKNCTFNNNTGGIVVVGASPVTIDNCFFTGRTGNLGEAVLFCLLNCCFMIANLQTITLVLATLQSYQIASLAILILLKRL